MTTFADRIRQARIAAGLTQKQLSERTEISQPHISQLESGKTLPSADTIARIAKATGIEPGKLFPT